MKIIQLLILLMFVSGLSGQGTGDGHTKDPTLTLLFTGDIMQHGQQLEAATTPDGYDFTPNYRYVSPIITSADVAIGNLELTLAGEPFSGYPTFSAPDELATALKAAGFDYLVTANNHSLDRRSHGLTRTIHVLDSLQIGHTGTFTDSSARAASYPGIIEKNGFRIAILNYTYGTNGIPVQPPQVVNYIDRAVIAKDILHAKSMEPDILICFMHWGYEYRQDPNVEQQRLARWMFSQDVDLVIGSHPHVLQPVHMEKAGSPEGKLVAYSLGNFISNQRTSPRDGGMMLQVKFRRSSTGETVLADAGYYLTWVYRTTPPDRQFYIIPEVFSNLKNEVIQGTPDREKMDRFIADSRALLSESTIRELRDWPQIEKVRPLGIYGDRDGFKMLSSTGKTEKNTNMAEDARRNKAAEPVFKIQVFAGRSEPDLVLLEKWRENMTRTEEDGLIRYRIGYWHSREKAEEVLAEIRKVEGFSDAFLVIQKGVR